MVEPRGTVLTGDLSRKQGADWSAVLTVVDGTGTVVNITAASACEFYVLDAPGGSRLITKTKGSGITITNGAAGQMTVVISASDTIAQTGMLWYEAFVTVTDRLLVADNEFEHVKAGTA